MIYPSQTYLWECFTYDDGHLFWKERPEAHFRNLKTAVATNAKCAGCEAGYIYGATTYIRLNGRSYPRALLVWILHKQFIPTNHKLIHVGDPSCDRIENLAVRPKAPIVRWDAERQAFVIPGDPLGRTFRTTRDALRETGTM